MGLVDNDLGRGNRSFKPTSQHLVTESGAQNPKKWKGGSQIGVETTLVENRNSLMGDPGRKKFSLDRKGKKTADGKYLQKICWIISDNSAVRSRRG